MPNINKIRAVNVVRGEPKDLQVGVPVDKQMLVWLNQEATAKGVSVAQVVRWAVMAQMDERAREVQPA